MDKLKRFSPLLTLVLAPLLALWPAILGGKAIGPFDQIRAMAPWGGAAPTQPWDVLQADGVLQFVPWRDLVFSAWGSGKMPFWNPYELAGTPLLANSQSAGFYPPHILMGLLHVPTTSAMAWLAWFHLALAGLGVSFLARKLGASEVGGVVSGVTFSLSAFMVSWTGLPSVITTVAWIPWVLGYTLCLFEGKAPLRHGVQLALCFSMLVLAGHLQFVAYGGLAAGIVMAWRLVALFPTDRALALRAAAMWAIALGLGGALAAPQLLPVLQYSQFSHRRNVPTEDGYAAYQASAIQPYELIGVMLPNLTGNPSERVQAFDAPLPAYWPGFIKRGGNFAEGALGIGPLVFGLLFLLRRRFDWRRHGAIAAVGGTALLLATGTALGRVLYFMVPGWSATGSPGRISVLFVLALCTLAGVGITPDDEEMPKQPIKAFLPAIAVVLFGILSLYGLMFGTSDLQSWLPQSKPELVSAIIAGCTSQTKGLALLGVIVAAGAIGFWLHQRQKHDWALVLAALACFPLTVPSVTRFSDQTDLKVEGPAQERVAVQNDAWDLLLRAPAMAPPNTLSLSRIHEIGGYDSLMHRDTVKVLEEIDPKSPMGAAPAANGNMMFVKKGADEAKLADAGVTQLWVQTPNGVEKQPITGPGRAYTPAGPATITSEDLQSIHLKATGPGTLVLKDRNMPGWVAKVDGKHVAIGGTVWREVDLPAGEHEVEMNYVPPGFMAGVFAALVSLVVLIAGGALSLRRRSPAA